MVGLRGIHLQDTYSLNILNVSFVKTPQ